MKRSFKALALASETLKLNFSGLLLSGHRNTLPILAVRSILRCSYPGSIKSSRFVIAMAIQAAPRTIGPNRGVLLRKVVPFMAFCSKAPIQGAVAGYAKWDVIDWICAVHAVYLRIMPQSARWRIWAKRGLNFLRRATIEARSADALSRPVMHSRIFFGHPRHGSMVPASFTSDVVETVVAKRDQLQRCHGRVESMEAIREYLAAYTAARSARFEGAA